MAPTVTEEKDRGMTETPQQDRVNTANLRDYSQLRRSRTDRKVAGVAGGLGRHLNIDPTILRVAFVVLVFFGGAGLLLYGALWLFVPEEGREDAVVTTSPGARNTLLLVTGVLAVLLLLGDSWGGLGFPWPLALVALVVALLLMNRDTTMSSTNAAPPPSGAAVSTYDTSVSPYDEAASSTYGGYSPPPAPSYPVEQPPAPRPDRGPKLFWFTVALLAVALGGLGLYDTTVGGVADAAYAALALTVVGVMLLVGAWFGRAGGLIALGLVATVALIATSVTEPNWSGDRRLVETPTTALTVQDRYFVPAGAIEVDLSNIRDIERLDGRSIDVEANAGQIVVILPAGVDVAVEADVTVAGEVTVLGETRGGMGVSVDRLVDGGTDAPSLEIDVNLVVGEIEVRNP